MSRAAISLISTLALVACSSPSEPEPATRIPPVQDAGVVDGITMISGFDPASGMHLDDDGSGATRPARPRNHASRPVEVTLRSTPSGAMAAVDGVQVGLTPTYWFGDADGREHEFTFVRPGRAVARYRFVPVQSGLVHARLEPADDRTAPALGPEIAPHFAPDAGVLTPDTHVVTPPPTVITPADAAAPRVELDAATSKGPQP